MIENNNIHIVVEKDFRNLIDQSLLKSTVKTILEYFNKKDLELTITIASEKTIRNLNKKYRSIDSVTDVLSFSANEINPETGNTYFGDVIISYPVVQKQSRSFGRRISEELSLLTTHGILHLLGYDHGSRKEEKKMVLLQSKLMQLNKAHKKEINNKMKLTIKPDLDSFRYAFDGIVYAFRTQKNIRIHLTVAILVTLLSIFLHCSSAEIAILFITMSMVISLELINTAIEATIDLVSPHSQPLAKIAKDLGAAAVLITAICSIIIGAIILGPKLITLLI
jgi:rRNA maturation RNase YbeY